MNRRLALVLGLVALLGLAVAGLWRAATPAARPSPDNRAEAIAAVLRCPTCQGLSVADSPSTLAAGMRDIIDEQIAQGRSPDEIRAWFVTRYGPWILLSPSFAGIGWLAWALPAVVVTTGVAGALAFARRGRARPAPAVIDEHVVDQTLAAYEAQTLTVNDTFGGQRLESALLLLHTVRADQAGGVTAPGAERFARERVALALAVRAASDRENEPATTSDAAPAPIARKARRGLPWAGAAAAFTLVLTGMVATSLAPRGADGVLTGTLPDAPTPAAVARLDGLRQAADRNPRDPDVRLAFGNALADADRLDEAAGEYRAALAQQPDDARIRLVLVSTLLRAGDVDAARAEVDRVLAEDADNPDAVLLRGLIQLRQGEPAAHATLRRFLILAPASHPGIELANNLLDQDDHP